MKILLSAAEISSDLHAAKLLEALRSQLPPTDRLEVFGIGGPQLKKLPEFRACVDSRELLVMGSTEVLGRLPRIYQSLKKLEQLALREKPDCAIVLDYPEFHFLLAKRLRRLKIPVIDYIPPKTWVWRSYRIQKLKKLFAKILCIFPFEEEFYQKRGLSVTYVGNPLLDELPFSVSKEDARREFGISTKALVITLLPGSRPSEIKRHFSLMVQAVIRSVQLLKMQGFLGSDRMVQVLIPLPSGLKSLAEEKFQNFKNFSSSPSISWKILEDDSAKAIICADAALVKSGTATLEAGLLGCPHAILYLASRLTTFLFFHVIRFRGPVGLVNLVGGWKKGLEPKDSHFVVREFIGDRVAKVDALSEELVSLIADEQRRLQMQNTFKALRQSLAAQGQSPSKRAASEILSFLGSEKLYWEGRQRGSHPFVRLIQKTSCTAISFLWSLGTCLKRKARQLGFISPVTFSSRVVSVGNIQVGGAGKTPLVGMIAREAALKGKSVCILTRGYLGSWEKQTGVIEPGQKEFTSQACGDEALLLQELAPNAWIGVGKNRILSLQQAQKKHGRPFDLVILDDGFQNFQIKKNLEIVLLTSKHRSEILFRDFYFSLQDADLIVFTKGENGREVSRGIESRPAVFVSYELEFSFPQELAEIKYFLVTGVADGVGVFNSLIKQGLQVVKHFNFSDHVTFSRNEVNAILRESSENKCQLILTGKDWIKWREFGVRKDEVLVIEPKVKILKGAEKWDRLLWAE